MRRVKKKRRMILTVIVVIQIVTRIFKTSDNVR